MTSNTVLVIKCESQAQDKMNEVLVMSTHGDNRLKRSSRADKRNKSNRACSLVSTFEITTCSLVSTSEIGLICKLTKLEHL